MILLIDNYDSFSYNLYQLLGGLEPDIRVVRNDALRIPEIINLSPSHIVLSPGPGRPADAGICRETVRVFGAGTPILGVCLGHQVICEAYGGVVGYAGELMHGKASRILRDPEPQPLGRPSVLAGLPQTFQGARYHSLAAQEACLPACLRITARTEDGEIMAVQHERFPVYGLQFHPESILTPEGGTILRNFLALRK
jgi:anthranilate synthase component 2